MLEQLPRPLRRQRGVRRSRVAIVEGIDQESARNRSGVDQESGVPIQCTVLGTILLLLPISSGLTKDDNMIRDIMKMSHPSFAVDSWSNRYRGGSLVVSALVICIKCVVFFSGVCRAVALRGGALANMVSQ